VNGSAELRNQSRFRNCVGTFTTDFNDNNILQKYSSYSKTLRIVALCLRFRPKNAYQRQLYAKEIEEAKTKIMKIIQASCFSHELKLSDKQPLKRSNINVLNPFIDPNGLIRIGGRLKGSKLTFPQKHLILFPSRHFIYQISLSRKYIKNVITPVFKLLYIVSGKNSGYYLMEIKCARSCDHVCGAFVSMPTRLIIRWVIYRRQEYPRLFRSPTLESISADRFI